MTAWGCLIIGQGFLTDWTQLIGTRVLLGILEVSTHLLSPLTEALTEPRPDTSRAAYFYCLAGTSGSRFRNASALFISWLSWHRAFQTS